MVKTLFKLWVRSRSSRDRLVNDGLRCLGWFRTSVTKWFKMLLEKGSNHLMTLLDPFPQTYTKPAAIQV